MVPLLCPVKKLFICIVFGHFRDFVFWILDVIFFLSLPFAQNWRRPVEVYVFWSENVRRFHWYQWRKAYSTRFCDATIFSQIFERYLGYFKKCFFSQCVIFKIFQPLHRKKHKKMRRTASSLSGYRHVLRLKGWAKSCHFWKSQNGVKSNFQLRLHIASLILIGWQWGAHCWKALSMLFNFVITSVAYGQNMPLRRAIFYVRLSIPTLMHIGSIAIPSFKTVEKEAIRWAFLWTEKREGSAPRTTRLSLQKMLEISWSTRPFFGARHHESRTES